MTSSRSNNKVSPDYKSWYINLQDTVDMLHGTIEAHTNMRFDALSQAIDYLLSENKRLKGN